MESNGKGSLAGSCCHNDLVHTGLAEVVRCMKNGSFTAASSPLLNGTTAGIASVEAEAGAEAG